MSEPSFLVVVGALIRDEQGKILLIRHPRRGWEFPQGRMEKGEGILAALHREIMEETGVRVEVGPLAAVWTKLSPPQAIILNFVAAYREGDLRTSPESPDLNWFAPEEALGLITHPVNRDRLRALFDFSGKTSFLTYSTDPYRPIPLENGIQAPPAPTGGS